MKCNSFIHFVMGVFSITILAHCSSGPAEKNTLSAQAETVDLKNAYGGYDSPEKWGEHLVLVGACHDCHTPKKMTDKGPVLDMDLALSGHHPEMPVPDIDRKMVESKGMVVTTDLTSWVGPLGDIVYCQSHL
jgi:hypothetical protein